ncbi:RDD family protein [Luteimonas sp. Y-2-2-4F]|nr:RDD family protein [Luteimonas sp. Y-2-2-4F]MCD9033886.1 RDD family protein [Luteimonas sp. Y-2-2-4F]
MAEPPVSLPRRYAAWSLDAALVALPLLVALHGSLRPRWRALGPALEGLTDAVLRAMLQTMPGLPSPAALAADPAVAAFASALGAALLPATAVFACALGAWGAGFEAWRGATPGKRALGLRVADAQGGRLAGWRHPLRQVAGLASWLTLNLGHLLAAVPPRRQALHDRIAGARVEGGGGPLPGWARGWLWLQAALACAALAWLAARLQAEVDASLLRVLGPS